MIKFEGKSTQLEGSALPSIYRNSVTGLDLQELLRTYRKFEIAV